MKSTILAIDDDPIILEIYQALLSDLYDIHLAGSGEEALEILKSYPKIDIILLDIMMPGLDGYQVCQEIRANSSLLHIKIILVSANSQIEERLAGYESGADDYIVKPFEEAELIAKIKVFLRLKTIEEINDLKGKLLHLVSHELRTPLNGILGFADILRESSNIDLEEEEFIGHIIICGKELLKLSEKAVLLSELKSGSVEINHDTLNLHQLLDRCRQTLWAAAEQKQVTIQLQGDTTAEIQGDISLLLYAFEMIMDNAIKFAHQGTVVEVTFHHLSHRALIGIANDGACIPEVYHKDIFGAFFVHDTANHHRGSGLSLAIAGHIAESHDGTLTIRNRERGPAFIFDLPA